MKPILMAMPILALLNGCAATPPPAEVTALNSPANADTGIRPTGYKNIIGDYHHREPVGPKPWRKMNDQQAPQGDGQHDGGHQHGGHHGHS